MIAKNRGAILVILIAIILSLLSIGVALAQSVCVDHETIVASLGERYSETRQNAGLLNENMALEVYSNPETGTWTVLTVTTEGIACLVAAGEVWLSFEQVEPAKGEPM